MLAAAKSYANVVKTGWFSITLQAKFLLSIKLIEDEDLKLLEKIIYFFDSTNFMPHGHCYLWRPDILWLNVGADLALSSAYFLIA